MANADANRSKLSYKQESSWNETPGSSLALKNIPYTKESLAYEKQSVVSNEIRSDRNVNDIIQVGANSQGGIDFELSDYAEWFDTFLRAALMADSVSSNANVALDDDFVAANVGTTETQFTGGENAPPVGRAILFDSLFSAGVRNAATVISRSGTAVKATATLTLTGNAVAGLAAQGTLTLAANVIGEAKATGVLTLTGNAGDTETVVIGGKTYTFQTVLTNSDGNVLIGATASDSIDNLIAAITTGAGAGTVYAAATVIHPTVTAAAGAGDTMDVTALTAGTAGNSIGTTETLGNGSFGGATLSGGTNSETVTIGSRTYTFQNTLTNVAGNVKRAANASDTLDNLIAAINAGAGSGTAYAAATTAHPDVTAAAGAGDTMNVLAKLVGTAGNSIATTETCSNGSWGGSTLSGGTQNETVTIGSRTYTFEGTLTDVNGNVKIGATASDTLDNLIAAINLAAGAGTLYAGSTTANAQVDAAAGAGDTMVITADVAGTAGNAIATTDTMTNGSWGGSTMSGGTDIYNTFSVRPQMPSTGAIQSSANYDYKEIKNGSTRYSFLIEKLFPDLGSGEVIALAGMMVNSMTLNFNSREILTGSLDFIGGRAYKTGDYTVTSRTTTSGNVLSASTHVGALKFGNYTASIKSASVQILNNLRGQDAIGDRYFIGVGVGRLEVKVSMEAYFNSIDLYNAMKDDTEIDVILGVQLGSYSLSVYIPKMKIMSGMPNVEGINTDIMMPIEAQAIIDSTENCSIVVSTGVALS